MSDTEFMFLIWGYAVDGFDRVAQMCEERLNQPGGFWDRTNSDRTSGRMGLVDRGDGWEIPPTEWCLAGYPGWMAEQDRV